MTNRKPTVIFDIGGVLLDWNPRYLYRKFFHGDESRVEDFLNRVCTMEWNYSIDTGKPFLQAIAERIALFPAEADAIRAFYDRWDEMLGEPYMDTVRVLESLRLSEYPLYALTNFSSEKFPPTRTRYPFLEWFQDIIVSGEVKLAKPDPEIFKLTLKRIGLPAADCIYIDDTPGNIEVAALLGFRSMLFMNATQLQRDLSREGIQFPLPAQQ
jgi:2-haloacid dehalogenase